MKLDSKYFDRIRVKPEEDRLNPPREPDCQWQGCELPGTHKAPKGRNKEGEYFQFCIDHVRVYNKSYNYFNGMNDDAVAKYQKDSATGHRPTWKMGVNRQAEGVDPSEEDGGKTWEGAASDPFGMFEESPFSAKAKETEPRRRKLKRLEKRSFEVMQLDDAATAVDIKARYKALVKRHHPDANGGDRGSEDRLRQIIQAYNHLKSAGFC